MGTHFISKKAIYVSGGIDKNVVQIVTGNAS